MPRLWRYLVCEECRALNAKNSWPILERFFKTLNKNKSKFKLDEGNNRKEHLELLSLYKKVQTHKEIEKINFLKKAVKNKEIRKLINKRK